MSTRITTLVENHPGEHKALACEHGLSFLIQHNNETILFDTGQSDAFLRNARTLNVDLGRIRHVVLSHGHYDHTNGLRGLVAAGFTRYALHIHESFFDPKYAAGANAETYLGPSFDRMWVESQQFRVTWVTGDGATIAPGVHIVTNFGSTHPLEVRNPRFVVRRPGATELEVDDFRDEISIVLETERGLVVVVGCSHPGIMNILSTVRSRFDSPIHAVLGGTHLVEAHGERLDRALGFLEDGTIMRLGMSHCTGDEAMDRMEQESEFFYRNVTGTSLTVA